MISTFFLKVKVQKLSGVIWAIGRKGGSEKIPTYTGQQQDGEVGGGTLVGTSHEERPGMVALNMVHQAR